MVRLDAAKGLAQHPLASVARYGSAVFFRNGKPDAINKFLLRILFSKARGAVIYKHIYNDRGGDKLLPLGVDLRIQVVLGDGDDFQIIRFFSALIAESCTAFCASSFEYLAAIGGGHSFAEAMLLLALQLLGLICSKHLYYNSLNIINYLKNVTLYYKHAAALLSRAFL